MFGTNQNGPFKGSKKTIKPDYKIRISVEQLSHDSMDIFCKLPGIILSWVNYTAQIIPVQCSYDRYLVVLAAGLSRPGKSWEGPRTGQDGTGPRDPESPGTKKSQDQTSLKVPGLFSKVPGLPGPFFFIKDKNKNTILLVFKQTLKNCLGIFSFFK